MFLDIENSSKQVKSGNSVFKLMRFTYHILSYTIFLLFSQVVGNCMIVSRSGLAAGYPPCMPLHRSWVDCWTHLSKDKQLKRGSQLLFRYYTGHQVKLQ